MKEAREQLVVLIGAPLLIAVPFLLNGANAAPFGTVAFGLGCLVLGGCSFGNEFQHRTLPLLLSQPVSRSVLWRDKMLVLAAAIGICLAALVLCQWVYCPVADREALVVAALIGLCAFCGAPCWTLVCRQTLAGMVSAVGVPVFLLVVYALVTRGLFHQEAIKLGPATILLTLYCALVCWLGYAQFQRLEAVDPTAGELTLPAGLEAAFARLLARGASRFPGPFASLLRKEFRLQQVSFLLAGVFLLIAVAGCCMLPIYQGLGEGILGGDIGVFVVVLPLVAGAMSVAEEKAWGLAEWHMTLPPSALQQWSAKMLTTLPTSMVLGLLLPWAVFLAGNALLPHASHRASIPPLHDLLGFVLSQVLLTSLAVYSASFSRTTLRAILASFGILIAGFAGYTVVGATASWGVRIYPPLVVGALLLRGHSAMAVLNGVLLLMLCLTQWFAWSNFRRSGAPSRRLMIQLLAMVLGAGLGSAAVTTAAHLPQGMAG
jgi:hypothetical protein